MIKHALFARLEARPGKEAEVAAFLRKALEMANAEAGTPVWFALRMSDSAFGVFDAFETEGARQAHLNGPIAQALMAQAETLFMRLPQIEALEVLGLKNAA
ncbi:antibiotic biosynthesis monooxygenase [Massilia sp. Dwa41.01b]|uniref:putative quinol monooxygenase n=1 Tax=unclassified Massilia TaxID=2609279 RepID=UPI0016014834|nr:MULTISPECIES: antibiotic biosynthesis monooxygenase [unclassified Massilia]QNA89020.1 antibiotic biosynthesis monooxygenase [Massilia sp. Dwa41.01b]QNA99908.1 antibiotic biosynthesis monooxygenase [Massilia sp. Se16.2.3]